MKQIYLLLLIVFLMVGCRSTKKLTESSAVTTNQTETVKKADVKEETKVNNDKSTYKKTTIIETEYGDVIKPASNDIVPADESKPDNGATEPSGHKRAVKSTKTTVIEEGTKDNSKIETKKSDNSEEAIKTKDSVIAKNATTEKKSVPIKWGWIFACSVLVIGVFIYFSKSTPATIVKTFLSKIFGK